MFPVRKLLGDGDDSTSSEACPVVRFFDFRSCLREMSLALVSFLKYRIMEVYMKIMAKMDQ